MAAATLLELIGCSRCCFRLFAICPVAPLFPFLPSAIFLSRSAELCGLLRNWLSSLFTSNLLFFWAKIGQICLRDPIAPNFQSPRYRPHHFQWQPLRNCPQQKYQQFSPWSKPKPWQVPVHFFVLHCQVVHKHCCPTQKPYPNHQVQV